MEALLKRVKYNENSEQVVVLRFQQCSRGCKNCGKTMKFPTSIISYGYLLINSGQADIPNLNQDLKIKGQRSIGNTKEMKGDNYTQILSSTSRDSGDEYCTLRKELELMMTLLPVQFKFWTDSLTSMTLRQLMHLWKRLEKYPPNR